MGFLRETLFQWRAVALLGAALFVRLALAPFPGFVDDTTNMVQYVRAAGHEGFLAVDQNLVSGERYPALFIYHTFLLGVLTGKHFQSPEGRNAAGGDAVESSLFERMSLRAIPIAYDLLTGAALLVFLSFFISRSAGEWGVAIYLFNPGTIMNAALWNYEAMPSFYILLAVIFCGMAIDDGRPVFWDLTWLVTALAFCSKLQAGMLVPVIGLLALLSRRLNLTVLTRNVGIFIIVLVLAYAPFLIGEQWDYLRRLFVVSFQSYATTHVNGYNLWALWFQLPADRRVLGVTLESWGRLFYLAALLWLAWQVWKQTVSQSAGLDAFRRVMIVAAYGCLAPFMLLTRMHERYLAYAIPACILAAMLDRRLRALMWGVSITYALNLLIVLLDFRKPWAVFSPGETMLQSIHVSFCVVRFFCSLLNVGLFVWLTFNLPQLLAQTRIAVQPEAFKTRS